MARLDEGAFRVLVVGGDGFNVISGALLPLGLGGMACTLTSRPELDWQRDRVATLRATASVVAPAVAALALFLASWLLVAASNPAFAGEAGLRNFGLGFSAAALVRWAGAANIYPAAGLFLMIPAIAPGDGLVSAALSIPFWEVEPQRDWVLFVAGTAGGLCVVLCARWSRMFP